LLHELLPIKKLRYNPTLMLLKRVQVSKLVCLKFLYKQTFRTNLQRPHIFLNTIRF